MSDRAKCLTLIFSFMRQKAGKYHLSNEAQN